MSKDRFASESLRLTQEIALIGVSALIGAVITLAIPFVWALLISSGTLSETATKALAIGACVIGALSAGLISARAIGRRALLTGIITGLCLFLILVVLGALFLEGIFPQNGVLPMLISSVLGGAFGSIAGAMLK